MKRLALLLPLLLTACSHLPFKDFYSSPTIDWRTSQLLACTFNAEARELVCLTVGEMKNVYIQLKLHNGEEIDPNVLNL